MLNVILFYFSYIGGVALSFLYNPALIFVVYESVYFFYPKKRWWGYMVPELSYSFYIVVLMAIILSIQLTKSSSFKAFKAPQIWWAYILVMLYGVANFYAVMPDLHYDAFINYLKAIIIISLALKLCDTDFKLDLYLYGYIFGSWYISFYIFQIGRNSGDRVEGIGTVDAPESNSIAAAIAPSLVLCLYYFWVNERKSLKVLFAVAGIFIANAIVLINSRGSFLAVFISVSFFIGYLYFSNHQLIKAQKLKVIFLVLVGLSGALYIADESFINRMSGISGTEINVEEEGAGTRVLFWEAAWEMAKDYPFGNGLNGFNVFAPEYIPEDVNTGRKRTRAVHSSWFEALTEIGYLGLISFILMVYSAYRSLNKCKKSLVLNKQSQKLIYKVVALQATIICFAVSMTFINRLRAEILYWLILFSAIAYNLYVINTSEKESKHAQ